MAFPGETVMSKMVVLHLSNSTSFLPPSSEIDPSSISSTFSVWLSFNPLTRPAMPSSPILLKSRVNVWRVVFFFSAFPSRFHPATVILVFPFRFSVFSDVLDSRRVDTCSTPSSPMAVSPRSSSRSWQYFGGFSSSLWERYALWISFRLSEMYLIPVSPTGFPWSLLKSNNKITL